MIGQTLLGNDLRKVMRALEKQDIEKAIKIIQNELSEEERRPGIKWIYAQLLATDSLPIYDLDSARFYILQAEEDYLNASQDELKDFLRLEYTLDEIKSIALQIEVQFYQRAVRTALVNELEKFMRLYPDSDYFSEATFKRDSLAYNSTKSINTWQAYKTYMTTYPFSVFKDQAKVNYDRLIFFDKTASGEIKDVRSFLSDHPNSPYRDEAIGYIFQNGLLNHDFQEYLNFIDSYPESQEAHWSIGILYHMDPLKLLAQSKRIKPKVMDSLITRFNDDNVPLVPYFRNGLTGLQSIGGDWFIQPSFERMIDEEFYCELFEEDLAGGIISGDTLLVNRSLESIYNGPIDSIRDIGLGGILIRYGLTGELIHKGGFKIIDNIEDAGLFDDRWFKVKRNDKWAIVSFSGVLLTDFLYDEVYRVGSFLVFNRSGELALTNTSKLLSEIGEGGFTLEFKFDDIELVNDSLLIGFSGERESLVDKDLRFIIPWDQHEVYPSEVVSYSRKGGKYYLYDAEVISMDSYEPFDEVQISGKWVGLKREKWDLYNLQTKKVTTDLDSVKLINSFSAFTLTGDTSRLFFSEGQIIRIEEEQGLQGIQYLNDETGLLSEYLIIKSGQYQSVWDRSGRFLFNGVFDDITCFQDSIFKISAQKAQGLVDAEGFYIVEPEYDFIQSGDQMGILLKDSKIGIIDLANQAFIEEEYDAAVRRLGPYYKTRKGNKWGVIDPLNQLIVDFAYQEIVSFNDTIAWVKTDSSWQLIDLYRNDVILSNVSEFKAVNLKGNKNVCRFFTSSGYGVIGEDTRVIIRPLYTDIRIVPGEDIGIFMAEHYFPDAGYYIVVVMDIDGNKLYSQAYREEEYEVIYCD
jgi:hypothetical protein